MIVNLIDIVQSDNFMVHSLLLLMLEGFSNADFGGDRNKTFLKFLENDNFSKETLKREDNIPLLKKLDAIKQEAKNFMNLLNSSLTKSVDKVTNKEVELKTENILNAYENYELQISRLRLVIQPEINITRIVHTTSKICYLSARGYWYVDFREKKRIFTKNFGKETDYELLKDDPKAIEDAIKEIQILCLNEYNSIYS